MPSVTLMSRLQALPSTARVCYWYVTRMSSVFHIVFLSTMLYLTLSNYFKALLLRTPKEQPSSHISRAKAKSHKRTDWERLILKQRDWKRIETFMLCLFYLYCSMSQAHIIILPTRPQGSGPTSPGVRENATWKSDMKGYDCFAWFGVSFKFFSTINGIFKSNEGGGEV